MKKMALEYLEATSYDTRIIYKRATRVVNVVVAVVLVLVL